jgi:DNA-binding beta-propeller fold protein YncE
LEQLPQRVPRAFFAAVLFVCTGCGGAGSSSSLQTPPPPAADFALSLSPSSLSLSQATSSVITVSVAAQNGFSGAVQLTLSGLPCGVVTNPAGSFSIPAGASVPFVVGASTSAATGSFSITAQGVGGSLSHSATLALTVQLAVGNGLPRTTYVRTDAIATLDAPPGEPRHRRIAYDAAHQHVFVANRAMNRVEVFSSVDQTRAAQINVPGASSADLSPDGSTVWIGAVTEQAVAIDTTSLQVRSRYSISALFPVPNFVFDRPEELLPMASGKILVRLRQSSAAQALLALWDPVANTVANLTSAAPTLFQNGLGAMARTSDHTKLVVAANDSSGDLAIFDASGNLIAGPQTLGAGTIPLGAANPDGSRIAVQFVSNGSAQLLLLDSTFNQAATPVSIASRGLAFSRDGSFLFVSNSASGPPAISVFDARALQSLGQVPDPAIQGVPSEIEEADESEILFAIANRGVTFIDASQPGTLSPAFPTFVAAPVAQPAQGPFTGATATLLFGQDFAATPQVKFAAQLAEAASVSGSSQIQAVSPPSVLNGGVNLTAFFPGGWLALAPDAFSYGPQILEILPNAGAKIGGTAIQVYGYGFGSDPTQMTATIGGAAATIESVANVTSMAVSLGFDATYPFSLQCVTLSTPPGTPGKADVTISSAAGTATAKGSFQYLQSVQVFAKAVVYKFLIYDRHRQWLYLSATDHVDVFDLRAAQFHTTPLTPPGGPPPSAALRGLSLTPDGTQLVVADFGAQSLYLINPDSAAASRVAVGGVAGFLNSGPTRVAATNTQTVFVGMSGEGGSCSSCLSQLDLSASPPTIQAAPQPQVTSLTGAPLVQSNAAGDRVFLAYNALPGGPVGFWSAASPNQFTTYLANESAVDLAATPDGSTFATRAGGSPEIRGTDLAVFSLPSVRELEQIPTRVSVPGLAMHPTGALLYEPFLTGPAPAAPPATGIQGGVDILDAHSGRLRRRILLPEPLAMLSSDLDALHGSFLVVDENGQRIFALTTSGVTVVQLANVPLAIGTISPASVSASGGATLTIRGSGFQSGATVSIGGKSAAATFVDINTLTVTTPGLSAGPQQLLITNPDGETATLDAAVIAN